MSYFHILHDNTDKPFSHVYLNFNSGAIAMKIDFFNWLICFFGVLPVTAMSLTFLDSKKLPQSVNTASCDLLNIKCDLKHFLSGLLTNFFEIIS